MMSIIRSCNIHLETCEEDGGWSALKPMQGHTYKKKSLSFAHDMADIFKRYESKVTWNSKGP